MREQLVHICRQILRGEDDHGLRCKVRGWMGLIEAREYERLARSMQRNAHRIGCKRLRQQVKAMVELLEEEDFDVDDDSEDGSTFCKIDRVVGVRFGSDGKLLYRVRWTGYGSDDDTWETREKLIEDGVKDRIMHFHRELQRHL